METGCCQAVLFSYSFLRFFSLFSFFSSSFPLLPLLLGIIPLCSGSFFALRYHFLFVLLAAVGISFLEYTHCFYGLLIPFELTSFNLLGFYISVAFFSVHTCIFHLFTFFLFAFLFCSSFLTLPGCIVRWQCSWQPIGAIALHTAVYGNLQRPLLSSRFD